MESLTILKDESKRKEVLAVLEKYENNPTKLIPILREVQDIFKYLPEDTIKLIAKSLSLSTAKIYGVATFFSHFTLEPQGKYVIRLCDGTACHVNKSMDIYMAIREKLGLEGKAKTTKDLLFTVETVSCLGACGLAPVVTINGKVYGQMTPKKIVDVLDEIVKKEKGE